MTEFQLRYMRFLQAKRDFPHLRHDGHEPEEVGLYNPPLVAFGPEFTQRMCDMLTAWGQKKIAEREFNRSDWQ